MKIKYGVSGMAKMAAGNGEKYVTSKKKASNAK